MPTIRDTIAQLLPRGTNPQQAGHQSCPLWPPDLFAVAATLIERSGCYAEPCFTSAWRPDYAFGKSHANAIAEIGGAWARNSAAPPQQVEVLWQELPGFGDHEVGPADQIPQPWCKTALKLLAVADEAAKGIGFGLDVQDIDKSPNFPRLFVEQHLALVEHAEAGRAGKPPLELPYIPQSLCKMIPDQILCVQPKTNTPRVGCTVRSFSHHLALLPPVGTVAANWVFAQAAGTVNSEEAQRPFNMLLVPFPYVVHGSDFRRSASVDDPRFGYFDLDPGWLGEERKDAAHLADFLHKLVQASEREVGEVHGIVLPETALTDVLAEDLAERIGQLVDSLELLIVGTIANVDGAPRNTAFTCRFLNGVPLKAWHQSKHHRWCLDGPQIPRYHLGHALNPDKNWWERIEVSDRECFFSVVRSGASLAVLVCEDLARFDPVMPVINAIGPNLVVALLMDGPQLERRWPGRYATVLADDPGCSVLTLTCLGMIRRSANPGDPDFRQIALWKQPFGQARELHLPAGHHGLALSLTMTRDVQFTMDGRSDTGLTRQFKLSGIRGIKISDAAVPAWMELNWP
ncbi:MAG: hypothetical protein JO128_07000 [Alphaproteobacteria bacterium]|nr:hypothetical protein [Alphaproteobacteria bacterium]